MLYSFFLIHRVYDNFTKKKCVWGIRKVLKRNYQGQRGKDLVAWDPLRIAPGRVPKDIKKIMKDFQYGIKSEQRCQDGWRIIQWHPSVVDRKHIYTETLQDVYDRVGREIGN